MTFITLEGLDNSGKTSALKAIGEEYPNAITTSEPSNLETGKFIRDRLSDEERGEFTDFYLFMADRVNHIEERIQPFGESDCLVVSDRYADSTRAYQPVQFVNNGIFDNYQEAIKFVERVMAPWNYEPDLTIYLDISVDTALERSSCEDKYEEREFLEGVSNNYEELIRSKEHGYRFIRVDAEQSPEKVTDEVLDIVSAATGEFAQEPGTDIAL